MATRRRFINAPGLQTASILALPFAIETFALPPRCRIAAPFSPPSSPVPHFSHPAEGAPDASGYIQSALTDSLHNMRVIMDPEFFVSESCDEKLYRFHRSCVDAVRVSTSSIDDAGRGLFARQDIRAGAVVSLYPVHVMGVNFKDEGLTLWVALDEADQRYFASIEDIDGNMPSYLLYLLGNRPGERERDLGQGASPFVDANPGRPAVPGWYAHYINDGAIVRNNSEGGVLDYLNKSDDAQNCVICPLGPSPLLAAVATRDVRRGEELFTSYGMAFWLEVLCGEGEDWAKRTGVVRSCEREMAMELLRWIRAVDEEYEAEAMTFQSVFDNLE